MYTKQNRREKKYCGKGRVLAAILCLMLCVFAGTAAMADDPAVPENPTVLTYGCTAEGVIANGGERAAFSFVPEMTAIYCFYSTGNMDTKAILYDSAMKQLKSDDDGGEGSNFCINYTLEAGQQYYFEAYYYNGSNTGTIEVHLSACGKIEGQVTSAATGTGLKNVKVSFNGKTVSTGNDGRYSLQADVGTGTLSFSKAGFVTSETENYTLTETGTQECNTSLALVPMSEIELDTATTAEILNGGDRAYFAYTATMDKTFRFTSYGTDDTFGELYDEQMETLKTDDDSGEDHNFQVVRKLEAGKTYYFAARYYNGGKTGTIPVKLTYDHTGFMSGKVTNAGTGGNLSGVKVTFGSQSTTTNYYGEYQLEAFTGTNDLIFTLKDYVDITIPNVTLAEDETIVQDVQMAKYIPVSAKKLTLNKTAKAQFSSGSEEIYFKFTAGSTQIYHIYIVSENSGRVRVFNAEMDELSISSNVGQTWQQHAWRNLEAGQTYYIRATASGAGNAYIMVSSGERALLAGHVTDAGGSGGISGATVTYGSSTATSDENGFYYFLLTSPKTAMLKVEKAEFITVEYSDVLTQLSQTTRQEAVLSEVLDEHEYRVVLTWGSSPSDLDSHLEGPGYHVYYQAMTGTNAQLDVDDTTSYGPETVTFRTEDDKTYTYYVHDFSNKGNAGSTALQASGAVVTVYNGGNNIATLHVPTGTAGIYWNVFTIRNGQISYTNKIGRKSPNDTAKSHLVAAGEYGINVVDANGSPIAGAKVTYDGETKETDEYGDAFFDAFTAGTPVLKVEKDGYLTWTNQGSAWTKSPTRYETVILYTEAQGELMLKSCVYSNNHFSGITTELTTTTKKISLGNDVALLGDLDDGNFNIKCEANTPGKVAKYQIWQGVKQIAESTDGQFALNSASFDQGGNCFVRVLGTNGEQVDTKINLVFSKEAINKQSAIELKGKKFSFPVGDDVPFIGGGTFEVDLPISFPLTFCVTEDKIQVGLNVRVAGGKTKEEQIKKTKEFVSDLRKYRGMKKFGKMSKSEQAQFDELVKDKNECKWFKSAELRFLGYAECDFGSTTATGCAMLQFKIKPVDFEFNTWVVVVPVTIQIEMSVEGTLTGQISYDWDSATLDGSLTFNPAAELKAFGGVGVSKLVGVGAYGSAKLEAELEILPNLGCNSVDLTGELGLKAYLGWLTYERPFAYNTWHLYTRNSSRGGDEDEAIAEGEQEMFRLLRSGMYDSANYKRADLGYLAREKNYLGQGGEESLAPKDMGEDLVTSFKALIEGTYRNAQPVMITANNALYAAFLQADANSGRIYTVVSKYDGTNWSTETAAAANNQLDNMPTLLADNAGRIWLAYARTGSGFDGESLLSYAQNQEIVVGQINPDTLAFTQKKVYQGNGYAHMQELNLVNGVPTLVWTDSAVSTDNDVLWPTNNTICMATCNGSTWSSATAMNTVQKAITELAVGEENGTLAVGVIADQDNDGGTAEDKELILVAGGAARTVAEGAGSISYATLPGTGTPTFLWLQNGTLYSTGGAVTGLEQAAGEFFIAGDSIYYCIPTETGAELCVSKYDNGRWGTPITLTNGDGYLEHLSIAQLNGKDYVMGMYARVTITDESVTDEKDLIWTSVSAVSDLGIEEARYDVETLTPGEVFPIEIEVENKGDHPVTGVDLSINGGAALSYEVSIPAGDSAILRTDYTCPDCLETVTVSVKESGRTDYCPGDNSYEFKVGYGDLTVELQSRQVGATTTVIGVVRNQGIAPASGRLLLMSMGGELLFEREIDALSSDQAYLISYEFNWNERTENQFDIKATLEANTEELFDYNNVDTIHLTYNGIRKIQNPGFVLPGQLRSIDDEAFAGIRATAVKLQPGITSIGSKAFKDCRRLEQIEIPMSVTQIAEDAFEGTSGFVIYCPAGSTAESFAETHHIICITE